MKLFILKEGNYQKKKNKKEKVMKYTKERKVLIGNIITILNLIYQDTECIMKVKENTLKIVYSMH